MLILCNRGERFVRFLIARDFGTLSAGPRCKQRIGVRLPSHGNSKHKPVPSIDSDHLQIVEHRLPRERMIEVQECGVVFNLDDAG